MEGSTNGLLLLRDARLESLYICNPITSEYINIPSQEGNIGFPSLTTYGLGVSKMTNQYKVVGISQKREKNPNTKSIPSSECHVYTLGTRSWRLVPHDSSLRYRDHSDITFLKGNLHWLVSDLKESDLISCFDLETEVFKAFSPPPPYLMERGSCLGVLAALGDRLCLCDNVSENEVVIWVMKEYGVEKSWTRDYVIRSKFPDFNYFDDDLVYPIKVFKDGVILVLWRFAEMFYYCNKTKTTIGVDLFEKQDLTWFEARLHVSSFISLKRFAMENVVKF